MVAWTRGWEREMVISKSPSSTSGTGSFLASPNANSPGLYPPEYRNRASCLVGLGRAHSSLYPAAYLRLQTPFRRGLCAGLSVGFSASSFRRASLIFARVEASTAPGREPSGIASRTDETAVSEAVRGSGDTSMVAAEEEEDPPSSSSYRWESSEESDGQFSSTSSDMRRGTTAAAEGADRANGAKDRGVETEKAEAAGAEAASARRAARAAGRRTGMVGGLSPDGTGKLMSLDVRRMEKVLLAS
mmetsp:Transcript_10766/g.22572  ORF Transcript_10766/g.22572 Transcript_10766/m.22572 type:complete len:245 (+) Transcript_10766:486-1220(+)